MPVRSLRRAALAAAPLSLLIPLGATATAAHKQPASPLHIGQNPAFTRVTVDLPAGAALRGGESGVETTDPSPLDGRAVVRARTTGPRIGAAELRRAGVHVRVRANPSGFTVLVEARRGSLKFVSYRAAPSGRRLAIDLWRNTTSGSARILSDGCLRIDAWSATARSARARGRELKPLFEHGLVLSLRRQGPGPTTIAEKPLIATEGTFRPDFSGYAVPGRWSGRLAFSPAATPRRAMLEAWSASAKDGSLECLAQTPVIIPPS